ncbi:MAG: sigma-70 family RNA polymerase sigma factor [Planctomycetota bacterium]
MRSGRTISLDIEELLQHEDFVRGLAHRLVFGGDRVDDVVQSTWLAALKRPPAPGPGLKAWLATVVRNVVRQQGRNEDRKHRREQRSFSPTTVSTPEELLEREELRRRIVDAVRQLDDRQRDVVLLRFFEGLPPRTIAAQLGVPVETVKTRLKRGMARLREQLDDRANGNRRSWQLALLPLAMPVPPLKVASGAGATAASIGKGILMSTKAKLALAFVFIALLLLVVPRLMQQPPATSEGSRSDLAASPQRPGDTHGFETPSDNASERLITESGRVPAAADETPLEAPTVAGTHVLRVILDGVTAQEAATSRITLTGSDERRKEWPSDLWASWQWQGAASALKSEFNLDPFLARVSAYHEELRVDELEVEVEHPACFLALTRVPLSDGVECPNGQTVHEVRVQLVHPEFWPAFTLAVRDAQTLAHLDNIELRIDQGPGMAIWGRGRTEMTTLFGDGVSSPIEMMGGRVPNENTVAALALSSTNDDPHLVELARRRPPARGIRVSARAPGYAWGSVSLDVSKGERELLLQPGATLDVRLTNVQVERYSELDTRPMLCIYWIREDRGNSWVHFAPLDEKLASDGLLLDSLVPGEYRVVVELGGGSWTKQPVLARAELTGELALAAGQTRDVLLELADPPAPPARATLGGMISFPAPTVEWAEEKVRLQVYFQPTQKWRRPDFEFSLADLERVGGTNPSWSFRIEDQPIGVYRVQLMPFLKVWMIDLPASGRDDAQLVMPELAEVVAETVHRETGELVPLNEMYYRNEEPHPLQRQNDFTKADTEEPGRFRFWAPPGKVMVWSKYPTGADRDPGSGKVLDLKPGLQTLTLKLRPAYAMRFEFREDGVALPVGDPGMYVMRNIRPIDHDGRVLRDGLQSNMLVEVSAPGVYEVSFKDIDADKYHPVPPRRVDVRVGDPTDVIVELRRK